MGWFDKKLIPLDVWIQETVEPIALGLRPFFQAVKWPIEKTLSGFELFLINIPHPLFLVIAGLVSWQLSNLRIGLLVMAGFSVIGVIGAWKASMTTLSLIVTAVSFCIIIGLPLGIASAKSNKVQAVIRPVMDVMQNSTGVRLPGSYSNADGDRKCARRYGDDCFCASADRSPD